NALIDESASDDDFGALEGVAVAASPVGSHFFAARWIEYWWEGLPLDLNQLRGIRRCFQSLRQDDGHGLACEAHPVRGQGRAWRQYRQVLDQFEIELGRRLHGDHTGQRRRLGGVD